MDKGAEEIKAMASRTTGASKLTGIQFVLAGALGLDEVIGGAVREKLIPTGIEKHALSCSVANDKRWLKWVQRQAVGRCASIH